MSDRAVVPVGGAAPYDVVIGEGVRDALPGMLPGADRVAVMYAAPVADHADGVAEVSAVVHDRGRVRAIAMRLSGVDGRWLVTVLQIG